MLFKDTVDLIPTTTSENAIGDPIEVDGAPRTIYANKKSVRQSEFYQAAQSGFKPELMFVVLSAEYQGEPKLIHEGKTYNIIRAYEQSGSSASQNAGSSGETTELICGGLVGA